ncbi:MAG TPA: hypothetical protein PLS84_04220 [Salinivirgaceae bacterium]|jgi:hypothetical protein|nr:hypothetical protein [Salinivirgaceae bacterium]
MNRPIYQIAAEIRQNWTKPYFGAVPYLQAMNSLVDMNSMYFMDDAKTIILYFLSNATTWRGDVAKRIKIELKQIAGIK